VPRLRERDPEELGHLLGRHRASQQPGAILPSYGFGFGFALVRAKGTAMASRMSAGMTTPSKCPYSSCTSAIGTSASRRTSRASRASRVSGMTGALQIYERMSSGYSFNNEARSSRGCTVSPGRNGLGGHPSVPGHAPGQMIRLSGVGGSVS
jgi:hypothetical protein